MKYIITNTATSLADIVWNIENTKEAYIQNISANDIYIDNKSENVLTEWIVLKSWNENVYSIRDYKKVFLQASWNSEVRILFS